MYFLTYSIDGTENVGVLSTDKKTVIPLTGVMGDSASSTMIELIKRYDELKANIKDVCSSEGGISIGKVSIKPPIPIPIRNIICVGKNYREHIREVAKSIDEKNAIPEYPMYFSKMVDRMLGPGDYIPSHSELTDKLDYESELAVIIGKEGRDIPYEKAEEYIFGYTILNDISVRDIQKRHVQWFKGKSLDGTCSMGPYIAHKSVIEYPPKLSIGCTVNGEKRQNSNTSDFLFDLSYLVSDFSKGTTLKPGDVISTGTPSGVGMGYEPPKFLKHGDVVECFIENIGTLRNTVD